MKKRINLTRRQTLQGMASGAAAAIVPKTVEAAAARKSVTWPANMALNPDRVQAFTSDWRFHRGDAPGAEAAAFDDSGWRVLDVPHDWSIEDLPGSDDSESGAMWVQGSECTHTGPFDLYASEGQTATGWTVGGIGWYRKSFDRPQLPPNGKAELRFEGVYMNCDAWLNG